MLDISILWAFIIAVGVFIYITLDGFDLGIGILFPWVQDRVQRDVMINSVAPVWDGNETWMVLGGAGLFAAFPLVYSTVLSALYLPIILMVLCLILRGVAFEFRFKSKNHKRHWDIIFSLGSISVSFLQGILLGAYIQGFNIKNGIYIGGAWDWLSGFSLFTGFSVVILYAALGCAWLIWKTEDILQNIMYYLLPKFIIMLLVIYALVSVITADMYPHIVNKWLSMPYIFYLSPIPVLVGIFSYALWQSLKKRQQYQPFIYLIFLTLLAYIGFIISLWPNIIPPSIDIWQASAPYSSQWFSLIGVALLLPVIVIYTGYAYWVFRAKVKVGEVGYHDE